MKLKILITVTLIGLSSGCGVFEFVHPGNGESTKQTSNRTPETEPFLDVTITDEEKQIIRDHHPKQKRAKRLPPGLQKKVERGGELPPGWKKKVIRGEVLSDDLYVRSRELPEEVVRRLPKQRDGVVTIVLEGKVIRLIKVTKVILDVFDL